MTLPNSPTCDNLSPMSQQTQTAKMNHETLKKWAIRKAHSADAPALKNCIIAAFEQSCKTLGGGALPPMAADYEAEIPNYLGWVVTREDDIIGGLVLDEKADHLVVGIVAVDPKS